MLTYKFNQFFREITNTFDTSNVEIPRAPFDLGEFKISSTSVAQQGSTFEVCLKSEHQQEAIIPDNLTDEFKKLVRICLTSVKNNGIPFITRNIYLTIGKYSYDTTWAIQERGKYCDINYLWSRTGSFKFSGQVIKKEELNSPVYTPAGLLSRVISPKYNIDIKPERIYLTNGYHIGKMIYNPTKFDTCNFKLTLTSEKKHKSHIQNLPTNLL
jgi:hypothetical protein